MDELLRVAAEIEGTPPRRTSSQHLLSGLVECTCGTKMYGVNGYVNSKSGRYCVRYYRCRRASHKGTCSAKQIPAAVVEPLVVEELRKLGLDQERLRALAGEAQGTFEAGLRPLLEQREEVAREVERVQSRHESLLELAEDRLISKQEFAARRARLESEQTNLETASATIEAEILARAASAIDIEGTLGSLRHLGDVFDELEDTTDRRLLLASCLNRVVVRRGGLDLHLLAHPLILSSVEPSSALDAILGKVDLTATEEALPGGNGGGFPSKSSRRSARLLGVSECMGAPAAITATLGRSEGRSSPAAGTWLPHGPPSAGQYYLGVDRIYTMETISLVHKLGKPTLSTMHAWVAAGDPPPGPGGGVRGHRERPAAGEHGDI